MKNSIVILRGINVTGHRKLKMAELKEVFEALGLKQVRTYIQSGNVVFSHEEEQVSQLQQICSAISP